LPGVLPGQKTHFLLRSPAGNGAGSALALQVIEAVLKNLHEMVPFSPADVSGETQ
jgi:hypothetical protein